jgi:hypothetical protein
MRAEMIQVSSVRKSMPVTTVRPPEDEADS